LFQIHNSPILPNISQVQPAIGYLCKKRWIAEGPDTNAERRTGKASQQKARELLRSGS